MPFNPKDQFDAAALYDLWFNCSHCTMSFDFKPGGEIGLPYYHSIGQEAKRMGWFVSEDGRFPGEEASYTILCPGCTEHMGLSYDELSSSNVKTESLYKLCKLLEKKRVA